VTGGAGFIGSHIVERLVSLGHEPVVLDDLSTGQLANIPRDVRFIAGSITNANLASRAMEGVSCVLHLAAQRSVTNSMSNPGLDAEVNVLGTVQLLQCAAQAGVTRFVFASTGGALYGDTDCRPTPETFATEPLSPYGISKLTAERYLAHYERRFGMGCTILRLANVYGPRQDAGGEGGVVAIFMERMLRGEPITVYGDGEQTRDYVYVEDVASAFVRAALNSATGTFNIGTGRETSVNELVSTLEAVTGAEGDCTFVEGRKGEVMRSCVDPSRAMFHLGWQSTTSLSDGLRATLEASQAEFRLAA